MMMTYIIGFGAMVLVLTAWVIYAERHNGELLDMLYDLTKKEVANIKSELTTVEMDGKVIAEGMYKYTTSCDEEVIKGVVVFKDGTMDAYYEDITVRETPGSNVLRIVNSNNELITAIAMAEVKSVRMFKDEGDNKCGKTRACSCRT